MRTNEYLPKSSETRGNFRLNGRGKVVLGSAALLLAAGGAVAFSSHESGSNDPDKIFGESDTTISKIEINGDGVNLRSDPSIPNPKDGIQNVVAKINVQDTGSGDVSTKNFSITVDTDDGVHTYEDANGTWYGINKKDLEKSVPGVKNANDSDGVIWVNEQRAKPVFTNNK